MNICSSYNINFQSRNKTIKKADKIARLVNREFPRISNSAIADMANIEKFSRLQHCLNLKMRNMRLDKLLFFISGKSFEDKLHAIIDPIKEQKLGNCSESANLATLAAKVNGITNCKQVHLVSKSGENWDHSVVYVEDKNPYIIDAWLGFADYLPKAIERYQKDYRNHFDFEKLKNEDIIIENVPKDVYSAHFVNQNLSSEEINTVKTCYPEFILK